MTADVTESQIAALLGKYSPAIGSQLRAARMLLRARFPRGFELVFDNYNALVFGISTTQRASDSFISVAGYPRWITLFFVNGTELHDPRHLLQGTGKQVRSIRLEHAQDINLGEVEALIAQAAAPYLPALAAAPLLTTIIKSIAATQRLRRPAPDSRPANASRHTASRER